MEQFLWTEKYRPKTVKDTILDPQIKKIFQDFVNQKNIPNLLLSGKAGVGKTSVARAVLEEIGCEYIIINGSLHGNIDTLRYTISNFASSISFSGHRKYVILDEADGLNPNSTQPSLRNFMELYSSNCGFILTCNYKAKIMPEIHSRCSVIDFDIPEEKRLQLSAQFMKRIVYILDQENVKYNDIKTISKIVNKFFPDWRRMLNEIQLNSSGGIIDESILLPKKNLKFEELVLSLKSKNFDKMRIWVSENAIVDTPSFYKELCDNLVTFTTSSNAISSIIINIAEFEYKEAFVANTEINRTAALLNIMADCDGEWS